MREGSKTLIAAVAVFLLAVGLVACGGGNDSGSTATEAAAQDQGGKSSDSSQGETSGEGKSSDAGGGSDGSGGSGHFVPKHHSDSGGGSEQFRVKGGDNSVQEFGDEADTSERDEAAAALHDFLDARAAGDYAAACSYLAKSVTESLQKLAAQAKQAAGMGCAGIFEKLTNPAAAGALRAEAAQADVGSLRIEGERAFIIYRGTDGTVFAMPMSNEDGSWKVAGLSGTPLS